SAEAVEGPGDRIKRALDSGVPRLYVNGFMNALTPGDVLTVLELNDQPAAVLNMSYTTAKTLAVSLGQIVAQLEHMTGREMLTTHDVTGMLDAQAKDRASSQ